MNAIRRFIKLALLLSAIALPFATIIYGAPLSAAARWTLAIPYYALMFGWYGGPYNLMLHNLSSPLHEAPLRGVQPLYPNVLGLFYGHSPNTYFSHHVGMHHPENNLRADLSSTLGYQRDSFVGFLRYFVRFFFGSVFELPLYFTASAGSVCSGSALAASCCGTPRSPDCFASIGKQRSSSSSFRSS